VTGVAGVSAVIFSGISSSKNLKKDVLIYLCLQLVIYTSTQRATTQVDPSQRNVNEQTEIIVIRSLETIFIRLSTGRVAIILITAGLDVILGWCELIMCLTFVHLYNNQAFKVDT
jgi:hypothetical protein